MYNKDDESARTQPWDTKGYKIPGGNIRNPQVAQMVTMGAPMIRKNTRGLLPAPEKLSLIHI